MDDTQDIAVVTPLDRAIDQWSHGNRIPLDLAAELIEEGYNVAALEAQYRN
jgi:hypothetical protein